LLFFEKSCAADLKVDMQHSNIVISSQVTANSNSVTWKLYPKQWPNMSPSVILKTFNGRL